MSISFRKLELTVSADGKTVLVFDQEFGLKYFTEVVVTTMLNSTGSDEAKSNKILNAVHAAGLNAGDYGKYSQWWARSNQAAREAAEQERREVAQHKERLEAMYATPEEIRKEAAEKRARAERMAKLYGRKGHEFGL